MMKWFTSLFSPRPATSSENEVQTLKLELAERDQLIAQLKVDLERQRRQAETQSAENIQAQVEGLFAELAMPLSQLQTQAHLIEVENRPVQARDLLVVAKRLVRVLEDHGLNFQNRVGEKVIFDPNLHEPLAAGVAPRPGQAVIIRFVGAAFRGRLLRKAGVEPTEDL